MIVKEYTTVNVWILCHVDVYEGEGGKDFFGETLAYVSLTLSRPHSERGYISQQFTENLCFLHFAVGKVCFYHILQLL